MNMQASRALFLITMLKLSWSGKTISETAAILAGSGVALVVAAFATALPPTAAATWQGSGQPVS